MEICYLPNKEIKIAVLKKLNELQKHRQVNEIKKTMHEQYGKFNKEPEIIKENQTKILQLKNTMNEMKSAIETINIRKSQAEERICELEDRTRTLEVIQ